MQNIPHALYSYHLEHGPLHPNTPHNKGLERLPTGEGLAQHKSGGNANKLAH